MVVQLGSKRKVVSICETQPLTVKGLFHLLDATEDLTFGSSHSSFAEWMLSLGTGRTHVLIIDKGLGAKTVLDALAQLSRERQPYSVVPVVVVWGMSITQVEALRFLQAGAKGILRKSADIHTVLTCLRAVSRGESWIQDSVFQDTTSAVDAPVRMDLTPREHQVMELVERGLKNREIAQELGIRPDTVKIHLKHIFEKTGVRGRHGLALSGLRKRE